MIYATTPDFLVHFGLASRKELPGIDELRAAGLLDPVDDALELAMTAREEAQGALDEDASGRDDGDAGLAGEDESA